MGDFSHPTCLCIPHGQCEPHLSGEKSSYTHTHTHTHTHTPHSKINAVRPLKATRRNQTDLLIVVLAKSLISESGSLWKSFLLPNTSNLQKSCEYSKKGIFPWNHGQISDMPTPEGTSAAPTETLSYSQHPDTDTDQ